MKSFVTFLVPCYVIVLTLCCVFGILIGLVFNGSTVIVPTVDPPTIESPEGCGLPGLCPKGCGPEVAGRYHLRSRTKRFFGRVA